MEPNTLLLAASGIALLAGIFLHTRKNTHRVNTTMVAEAQTRAKKRVEERALIGNVENERFDFSTNSISVKHHGSSGIPLHDEQVKAINAIFNGYSLPAKHRPVFPIGKSANEAASVPLKDSAFDELNTADFSKQVEVEFIDPNFNWPERYDLEEKIYPARAETVVANTEFTWPEKFAK